MKDGNYKILLIDDDADDAALTIYTLKKLNIELHHINDGEQALKYLFGDQSEPPLILLDLKMPKVDGIQILRKLKADPNKRHIPVVVLISSKEGQRYVESFKIHPDGYLMKPVDCKNFLLSLAHAGLAEGLTFSKETTVNQDMTSINNQ